jgi:hypothetical protein
MDQKNQLRHNSWTLFSFQIGFSSGNVFETMPGIEYDIISRAHTMIETVNHLHVLGTKPLVLR